jgi:flavin reductase (DIM6/NTAB) family NADH-FMN oxidoreductase RutF
MASKPIGNNAFIYPMPVTLVGTRIEGWANFMAVSWVTRVNGRPPMMTVVVGKGHLTDQAILKHEEFSINLPSTSMLEKADYCGTVAGRVEDKAGLFEVFDGELSHAPMIRECPLTMECRVQQSVDLPTNRLYLGEIVQAYCDPVYMTDGIPDPEKLRPFVVTLPDKHYWQLGDQIGEAWRAGNSLFYR